MTPQRYGYSRSARPSPRVGCGLQTNKAKDVAALASEFHALDNLRGAGALDRRLQTVGRSLDVYVQVNTSAEESKYGVPRTTSCRSCGSSRRTRRCESVAS